MEHYIHTPSEITKDFLDKIIGNDMQRGNRTLGNNSRTATLFRIDYMQKCILAGMVQDVTRARGTIEVLEGML